MPERAGILVVDDDANFCNTTTKILCAKGYDVAKAESGLRALELIREKSFDVVLMDIKMPAVSGVETCRQIKKMGSKAAVILMTAFFPGDVSEEALRAGAYAVMPKPFDVDRVIHLIDEILLKKRNG